MTEQVTMVRIYLSESKSHCQDVITALENNERVRGLTVFRGIEGYGDSKQSSGGKWLDLSLDLPITIEFFDQPDKVQSIIEHLKIIVKSDHIVSWPAEIH